jgi:very-short-patch-repair endonuclease
MEGSTSNQDKSSATLVGMLLANKGFRVLRFNNHDVMTNRQGVLETIAAAVGLAPSLTLQPKSDLSDFGQLIRAELG